MKPIIFLRVAWMKRYQGLKSYNRELKRYEDDIPLGGGTFINENKNGGEIYNYLQESGKLYGYTRPASINIKRIGASSKDAIENVTVVWFAKKPNTGGQYIVGWYKNATVYKHEREYKFTSRSEKKYHNNYIVTAKVADSKLIPPYERDFELYNPKPGQNSVWFGYKKKDKHKLTQVWNYIDKGDLPPTKPSNRNHKAFQQDIEKKKKVELAAIDAAINYFEKNRYTIKDVQKDNKGWDLEAHKAGSRINIEVKGLSGTVLSVELSANEYNHFMKKSPNYRLFVLRNALSKKPIINLFRYNKEKMKWVDEDNNKLNIKEVKTASLSI